MPVLYTVKIYTRTGDTGETSLFGGTRVSKSDARVDAYGEVDELNAWLGFARATLDVGAGSSAFADLGDALDQIQRDLFALGARLAILPRRFQPVSRRRPFVTPMSSGSNSSLIGSKPSCRPSRTSFLPGCRGRRGVAPCAGRLPPRGTAHGDVAAGRRPDPHSIYQSPSDCSS
jgi:cob(I)alamin adenosyltransferase